uniref:ATP synthase F1 complex delta/epsilon subunit N-terminal domain-containing protein n=1 Tax=Spongospora subterranea TaxID=70186 RepID=A0A0H5R4T8_9EUKA|eukprot:CRZ08906.1 hypothetical protein [Spongospora subterranea]
MLGCMRTISRGFRSATALRAAADDTKSATPKLRLNFNVPHQAIVKNEEVHQVTIPGTEGEFGVLAGHVPIVAELQPGVVTVDYGKGDKPSKYFVSGGFAFVHQNSTTDISAVEAIPLDEFDPSAIQDNLQAAQAQLAAATDPKEKAIAQIMIDVNKKLQACVSA